MIYLLPLLYLVSIISFAFLGRKNQAYGPVLWGSLLLPVLFFLISRPETAGNDLTNYYAWMSHVGSIASLEELSESYPSAIFSLMLYIFSLVGGDVLGFDVFQFSFYFLISLFLYMKGGRRLVFLFFGVMFFTRIYLDFSSNAIRGGMAGLIFSLVFISRYKVTILIFVVLSALLHWKQSVAVCVLFLSSYFICFVSDGWFERNKKIISFIILLAVLMRLYIPEVILSYLGILAGIVSPEEADYLRLEQVYSGESINRLSVIVQLLTGLVIPYLFWLYYSVSSSMKASVMKVFSFQVIILYFIFVDVYSPVERLIAYAMPIVYIGLLEQSKNLKVTQAYFLILLVPLNIYGLISLYDS